MMNRWTVLVAAFGFLTLVGSGQSEENSSPPREVGADEMFTERVLVVKGEGLAPSDRPLSGGQRRLMAKEAAKVVAFKNLAEVLSGVRISGETYVKNIELANSEIRADVQGMVRGAHVVHEAYDAAEGSAAIYLRVNLDGPNGIATSLLPAILERKQVDLPKAPVYKPAAAAPPAQLPEPADSLIVDATGKNFRPALFNRILAANGSVLFEPSKGAPGILTKKGCGDYTSDIGKAKAILADHGAKNPLIITVASVQRSTDAQVAETDAAAIFTANQKTNFLEGAKVVFVL